MPHAPNYTPNTSFANDETNQASGRSTVRTQKVDDELANLEITVNGINTNLKKLQRDDGKLKDLSVEPYALSEITKSLLASRGQIKGLWQPNTKYKNGEIVQYLTAGFAALYDHTSTGAFDYNQWLPLSGDGTATQKAVEAANSALSALNSANNADISEAAALAAQTAAEGFKNTAQSNATTSTNAANSATAAQNTALNAANSAQLNANAASASAIDADASADLAYQYSLLASPIQYAVTTGTSSAYEAALTVPIAAYADEQTFKFKFDEACVANATLRISGLNPPLDLKIQASDGAYVNVAANDIIANHVTFGLVIEGGTALLIQPAVVLENLSSVVANTTFTIVNALDRTIVSNGANLNHILPLSAAFPVGGRFAIYSESPNCVVQRQGSNTIKIAGSTVNSVVINQGSIFEFINTATGWFCIGQRSGKAVGEVFTFSGTAAPEGSLALPLVATNVSRATYAALFAAIGTTWGAGDGSTTFGLPWMPADYASIQANANVGTQSVGQVISHNHAPAVGTQFMTSGSGSINSSVGTNSTYTGGTTTANTGGSANLAAGTRFLYCVQFQ